MFHDKIIFCLKAILLFLKIKDARWNLNILSGFKILMGNISLHYILGIFCGSEILIC